MDCVLCKAKNQDGQKYCGACGAPLDPIMAKVRDYVESGLGKELAAFRDRFQDQKAVDIETTEKIATRLTSWAKMFGLVVGVPLSILVIVLTILGVNTVSELKAKANEIKDSIKATAKTAEESIKGKEAGVETLAAALKKKEVELDTEIERFRSRLKDVEALATVNKIKLAQVEEKFIQFEASSALTPELQRKLNESIDRYQRYLETVGFKFKTGKVTVFIDPNLTDNSLYELDKKRLVLGPLWANDPTVVYREFTHHALTDANALALNHFESIESGLADYFASSFTGDPAIGRTIVTLLGKTPGMPRPNGKPYIRTMDNNNKFSDLKANVELHHAGETLGGALWEIRRSIGANPADRLAFSAWVALTASDAKGNPMERFAKKLLEAAAKVEAGKHVKTVEQVFASRGLKVAP